MTAEEYQKNVPKLQKELGRVVVRFLPESEEREDVVQETMLRLWQMHEQLKIPVEPFAMAIAKNLCLDRLRREQKFEDIDSLRQMPIEVEPSDKDERIERMMAIIDTLPSMQQTVLRLRHLEGMEFKDIAQMTGMNEAALRKTVSRARQAVREIYLKQYQ